MAREFFEFIFCFFNDTATTEIYTLLYTLSLHERSSDLGSGLPRWRTPPQMDTSALGAGVRSEEHTSELQSHSNISYAVFCLKKKKQHPRSCASVVGATDANSRHNASIISTIFFFF